MTMTEDAPMAVEGVTRHEPPELTDAQKRDAARAAWRDDPSLTGAELGRRHGMTEGWGRKQIREARDASGTPAVTPRVAEATAAPPAYGPPAPAAERPRRVNGTARTAAPEAPLRLPKPAPRKPQPEAAPQPSGALVVVTKLAVAVVAAVAAVVSYCHTRDLALAVGQDPTLASLLPLSVDGLVVVGSTSLLIDRQYGRPSSGWAALAVTIGLAASLAANVVSVDPTVVDVRVVRWVMAAYAPVALAIAGHLLLRMLDQPRAEVKP